MSNLEFERAYLLHMQGYGMKYRMPAYDPEWREQQAGTKDNNWWWMLAHRRRVGLADDGTIQ